MKRKLIIAVGVTIAIAVIFALVEPLVRLQKLNQSRWERRLAFTNAYRMLTYNGDPPEGRLPDIIGIGDGGHKTCSWRLRLLQNSVGLSDAPRPDESWNSAHNLQFTHVGTGLFCRANTDESYILAVTGQGTAFPPGGGVKFSSLDKDTIILIEVANSGFNWAEPRDFEVYDGNTAEKTRFSHVPGSVGDDSFLVVFADGTSWLLRGDVPNGLLAKFLNVELAKSVDRSVDLKTYRVDRDRK